MQRPLNPSKKFFSLFNLKWKILSHRRDQTVTPKCSKPIENAILWKLQRMGITKKRDSSWKLLARMLIKNKCTRLIKTDLFISEQGFSAFNWMNGHDEILGDAGSFYLQKLNGKLFIFSSTKPLFTFNLKQGLPKIMRVSGWEQKSFTPETPLNLMSILNDWLCRGSGDV